MSRRDQDDEVYAASIIRATTSALRLMSTERYVVQCVVYADLVAWSWRDVPGEVLTSRALAQSRIEHLVSACGYNRETLRVIRRAEAP